MGGAPTVETPIQHITHSLGQLARRSELPEDVKSELLRLKILTLTSGNLYQAPLPKLTTVDEVTRSYLQNELAMSGPRHAHPAGSQARGDDVAFSSDLAKGFDKDISSWDFNAFEHTEEELLLIAKRMFTALDLLNAFKIPDAVCEAFLLSMRSSYLSNPYHNWRHAVDVTQASFCYVMQFDGHKWLTQLDLLALLVASLAHDIGHPGVNNVFMTTTLSDLAVVYNDQSVLENFHAATLFQLMRQNPQANMFATLTSEQFKEARKSVIECIIATDSSMHYEYVTKLSAKVESNNPQWNPQSTEDRLLLLKCIIKMADISNVARVWERGGWEWSQKVTIEFFAQGWPFFCFFQLFFLLL